MRAAAFGLSWVLSAAASQAEPTAAPAAVRPWPCRLVVEGTLLSAVQDAWRRSPTLQQQCRTLAEARAVVRLEWGKSDSYTEAASRIGRDSDGVIVAIVSVPPVANAIELVAHEMEHVIERVEGRDLPREARRRGSGVWETFRGRFESRRAIEVGRQVAREVEAPPGEPRQRKPASKKDAPRTIGKTISWRQSNAYESCRIRGAAAHTRPDRGRRGR